MKEEEPIEEAIEEATEKPEDESLKIDFEVSSDEQKVELTKTWTF